MGLAEEDLIARWFVPLAGPEALGLTDDAGLVSVPPGHELVVTKDALVAGVHFFPGDPAGSIARKALGVNLSDLAAKGARPLGFLLAIALPRDWTAPWLDGFVAGLAALARAAGCPLIGGDTVSTDGPLVLSITALGLVAQGAMVRRTGACAGDVIYVSGTIGDGALGLAVRRAELDGVGGSWVAALTAAERFALRDRYWHPVPRLALAAALAQASGAMDVSDGLVGDLDKMLRVSGVAGRMDASRVPLSPSTSAALRLEPGLRDVVLTGGDDYEVLATVPVARTAAFEAEATRAGVRVSAIGLVMAGSERLAVMDETGTPLTFRTTSFSHT